MLAGTVSPFYMAKQVADDTASLADAGILFPADSAGILFPVVPAGIPFPTGPVGPVGPVGTLSPFDSAEILFSALPAGIPFPAGPVGPVGSLSPSDSAGVLSSAVPAGILFPAGPVGPNDLIGMLSPSNPARILFPVVPAGKLFPVAPDCNGTLSPTDPAGMPFPADSDMDATLSAPDHAGMLFPAVLTEFPVLKDPVVTRLPADHTVFDTRSVVDMAVMDEVRPSVPDVVHGRAVVAMVGVDAVRTREEIPMDCDIDSGMWDPRNDFETVDGMPVYYGGDFNDSDCEDSRDLAYEDWLDLYNLNAPEGCCVDLPEKGDDRLPNAMGSAVMMVGAVAQLAHVRQDLLVTSDPMMDIEITVPVVGERYG